MVQTHRPPEHDAAAPARHEESHGEDPCTVLTALCAGCGLGSWQAPSLLEMLLSLNEPGINMHVIMVYFIIIMTDSFFTSPLLFPISLHRAFKIPSLLFIINESLCIFFILT